MYIFRCMVSPRYQYKDVAILGGVWNDRPRALVHRDIEVDVMKEIWL